MCQVSHWVNAICDRSMQELHDLSKPFKYVVSCVIVQKNGAGFHIGHSAYWDISNDNICQARQLCCLLGWIDIFQHQRSGRGRRERRSRGTEAEVFVC